MQATQICHISSAPGANCSANWAKVMLSSVVREVAATSVQAACKAARGWRLRGDVALHRGRAFDHGHHVRQRDLLGTAGQRVAASNAAGAANQSGSFEPQQYLHQEPRRNPMSLSNIPSTGMVERIATPGSGGLRTTQGNCELRVALLSRLTPIRFKSPPHLLPKSVWQLPSSQKSAI